MTKRLVCMALCMVLVCVAVMNIAVNAEDFVSADWSFDVSYAGNPGEFYSLVAIEGDYMLTDMPEVTEQNVIYIDQVTADENGYAHFETFIPMRESVGTLYLGGSDLDAPVLLGRITDKEMEFVYDENRVIVKYNGEGGKVVLPEGTKGIYDASVFDGYNVTELVYPSTALGVARMLTGIKSYYHPRAEVDFSQVTLGDGVYIIGDLNNNGKVDYLDLRNFLKNRTSGKKYPADSTQSDINIDGNTDLKDASDMLDYAVE